MWKHPNTANDSACPCTCVFALESKVVLWSSKSHWHNIRQTTNIFKVKTAVAAWQVITHWKQEQEWSGTISTPHSSGSRKSHNEVMLQSLTAEPDTSQVILSHEKVKFANHFFPQWSYLILNPGAYLRVGKKKHVRYFLLFPYCSNVIRLISNPVPQPLSSFTKTLQQHASKTNDGLALWQTGDRTRRALKPLSVDFCLGFCFVEADIQQKRLCPAQKKCATVSLVLQSWAQTLLCPWARCHCSGRLWVPTVSCNPQHYLGTCRASTHTSHTGCSSPSGELIKAAMAATQSQMGSMRTWC